MSFEVPREFPLLVAEKASEETLREREEGPSFSLGRGGVGLKARRGTRPESPLFTAAKTFRTWPIHGQVLKSEVSISRVT
jgi:hypothetical protein